ncbi:MAG: DUF378 domain-containing protein [Clostridia bacterium]|nr:DUF378 domain-containing protein [Clostridia bacterium]
MLTFFSFIIVMLGSLNWFFIGAFQYDFIAGLFGLQASLFSRFFYFVIGMAAFVLLSMAVKNKGTIKLTENSFKKIQKMVKVEAKDEENEEENENTSQEKVALAQNSNQNFPFQEKSKEGYKDFDASKYDN